MADEKKEPRQSHRKFILACFFSLAGAAALFIAKMSGGEFITLAALILSIYGGANVAEKVLPAIFGNRQAKG